MPSKRKTRSSPAATAGDSASGESLNKSRKKANPKTAEAVAASPAVEKKQTSNNVAAPMNVDDSTSGESLNKSRKNANLKTVEAAEAVVEKKETSNNYAAPITVDDNGSDDEEGSSKFVGDPIPDEEARRRWPQRYQEIRKQSAGRKSNSQDSDDEIVQARRHYKQAEVDGCTLYNLYDDAHVKAGEGEDNYICKIVEMFEDIDGKFYFTAQWYYRAKDTVIQNHGYLIEPRRVFFSEVQNDNPLDCLVEKLNIARIPLNVDPEATKKMIPKCDYYCDMLYLLPYSTFVKLPTESKEIGSEASSTISSEIEVNGRSEVTSQLDHTLDREENKEPELKLLDLYSGCGAMSTGLCQGGILSGSNIVTRWAVDLNEYACQSLKLNHPKTEVRNESAENFLSLMREWEKLCSYFSLVQNNVPHQKYVDIFSTEEDDDTGSEENNDEEDGEVFEVSEVLAVCYGDPNQKKESGLYFKVSWKGYGSDYDSWEPVDGLSNCKEKIKEFVTRGFESNVVPLPGGVDIICGGPPCQGISGFNRFRNRENPLDDEKNKQLVVFMDIVYYLRPKFALMENVVDILKFADGFLGRYALGRLVQMNYQSRLGIMAAGCYGLPQFRGRVFLWGAAPSENLPQYPLPTHDVIMRGVIPKEFEGNTVAYNEGHTVQLRKKLLLEDAISDLPPIENNERRDDMPYDKPPQTEFQRFIRLSKSEMLGVSTIEKSSMSMLHDHRSLELNKDDYQRVCRIPKKKGGCFRDLPGVRVGRDNKVEWDPDVKREYLDSGKPVVPDYAMSFVGGTSSKPFARLWWDETVPTVVTRAEPHNQAITHPEQDRVLSIRENARLQGFPDFYKLCGPVKQRYIQVGNAVAVPVARALGYTLGLAFQGSVGDGPLYELPDKFPMIRERISSVSSEDEV